MDLITKDPKLEVPRLGLLIEALGQQPTKVGYSVAIWQR